MTQIEQLLAQCLDDLEQGASVQECLARYPERGEELQPLLRAAQRVRSTPRVTPAAAFRRDARARMLNKIQAQTEAKELDRASLREGLLGRLRLNLALPVAVRRLTLPALATIAIIILLGMASIGVVYASSESLPGDSLYPVKLAGERIQLALSPGHAAEARLHLRLAGERLHEAARLTEMQREDRIETLMSKYVKEIEAASRILRSQHAEGRDVTLLSARVREHLAQQQVVLRGVREEVSEGIRPAVERAMAASRVAEKQATATMGEEPPASPRAQPTSALTVTATATAIPTPSETPRATRTPQPTQTCRPTETAGPTERLVSTQTLERPGQSETPQRLGQTKTPQPPGQTDTPQALGQTNTPRPPDQTNTPPPSGHAGTPQASRKTRTPEPPGEAVTPGRPGTPEPPGQPGPQSTAPPGSPRARGTSQPDDA